MEINNKTIVISQPMYFPWAGMHEQMCLADVYVDYNDVAFSKGSFTNRVQIKTPCGWRWLTLPLSRFRLGQSIREVKLDESQNWRTKHMRMLEQSYVNAPFVQDMLAIIDELFQTTDDSLANVSLNSMLIVHRYFAFDRPLTLKHIHELGIDGAGGNRVLSIVKSLGGKRYVTGHGAMHYLDHELFEKNNIDVEYMEYQKVEYPQIHPPFNPYVSALDIVANLGRAGASIIKSHARPWREVLSNDLKKQL